MYCLRYQNIHILLGNVLISIDVTQLYESRDIHLVSNFIVQLILYSDIPTIFKLVKMSYRLSYHTVSLTKCYVICYNYELCKITSTQCTFVINNAASTMISQAHSSFLTLHNGLFVWICILTASKTYIQYCLLNVYLTNNEPGTTIHTLYKIIIFKLLLIHVINKLGVYYY